MYSASHPSGVGKWVPTTAGMAEADMAHADCGWSCGCVGKTVRSPENVPYLSASELVFNEEALYQNVGLRTLTYSNCAFIYLVVWIPIIVSTSWAACSGAATICLPAAWKWWLKYVFSVLRRCNLFHLFSSIDH